jgi:cyclohexadieny/prephenate dehydrogenase
MMRSFTDNWPLFMFDRLCIIGVGLLGGAIGIQARKRGLARRVVGAVRRKETIKAALAAGAVDEAYVEMPKAARDADAVLLASPVGKIVELGRAAAPHLEKEAVVTDVGSVKGALVAELEAVFGGRYIGSHPLAGSEHKGVEHAGEVRFEGALCIMTPTEKTMPASKEKWGAFWKALGFRMGEMTPDEHEAVLARTSHLPHAVASALMRTMRPGDEAFAGGGLLDTTRIAASDADLWRDILVANRVEVSRAIGAFTGELEKLRGAIERGDAEAVRALWAEAQARREKMKKNF